MEQHLPLILFLRFYTTIQISLKASRRLILKYVLYGSVLHSRIIWINLPLRHSFHLSLLFLQQPACSSPTGGITTFPDVGQNTRLREPWSSKVIHLLHLSFISHMLCSSLCLIEWCKLEVILYPLYIQISHLPKCKSIFLPFIASVPNMDGSVLILYSFLRLTEFSNVKALFWTYFRCLSVVEWRILICAAFSSCVNTAGNLQVDSVDCKLASLCVLECCSENHEPSISDEPSRLQLSYTYLV